jgi:hypothetical protein
MLKKMMEQFAKEMGVEDSFATEVPGVYQIPIDEGVNVLIQDIPSGFSIKCNIVDCPKTGLAEYFTHIMGANLLGKETNGHVLGLNEEGDLIILSRDIDYDVDYKEFTYILEDFFNQVDFWRQETLAFNT